MGHDLKQVLEEVFNGVKGKIHASPPKHLRSALNQMVNYIFTSQAECYDNKTEVLTLNGWKKFEDVSYSDLICTLNKKTKEVEYQKPSNIIKKKSDSIIEFNSNKFDIAVTPNHKMLVQDYSGKLKTVFAKDFDFKKDFLFKNAIWNGDEVDYFILPEITTKIYSPFKGYYEKVYPYKKINMDTWLKFFAMFITEGSLYERDGVDKRRQTGRKEYLVRIAQVKFKDDFRKVMDEMPFNYYECKEEFIISNKQLFCYLKQFGKSHDKFIPKEFLSLSKRQLNILYTYLKLGDGLTNTSDGNEKYFTASKKLADDVQELYMKLGYVSNIYKCTRDNFVWYIVSKQKSKIGKFNKEQINKKRYNDFVYCVTVDNGTLYTRRNGKASWGGNCAGAQAFSNFDTLLAPFVKKDKLDYAEIKQSIQEYIFSMNVPNRVGFQAPFSNITLDIKCPDMFKDIRPKIGGKELDFTYGDCNEEIGLITKAFFEIMSQGDGNGNPFSFPIPTINLHKNFIWDDDVARVIFEATAKYGTPNFQNFLNSDINPEDTYSMCCRLRIDKKKLLKNTGGLFGSSPKTGSIGVVTLNLPLIAYEAKKLKQPDAFFKLLIKYMNIAKDSLEIKRKLINENMEKGLVPYMKRYVGTYKNHFSTIGLVGGNEMCLNLIGKSIETKEGQELMESVLIFMKEKISSYQEETDNYYNLEQTPAESTAYKFAKSDLNKHNDIAHAGTNESPYYTNSSHLQVNHNLSMSKMLEIQDKFNIHYNGGTTVHIFLGEKVSDWINCMLLVKKIAEKTTLPFFTITPIFSICPVHGYISGAHKYCPLDHSEKELNKYGVIDNE